VPISTPFKSAYRIDGGNFLEIVFKAWNRSALLNRAYTVFLLKAVPVKMQRALHFSHAGCLSKHTMVLSKNSGGAEVTMVFSKSTMVLSKSTRRTMALPGAGQSSSSVLSPHDLCGEGGLSFFVVREFD